jgi:hypothetical protein
MIEKINLDNKNEDNLKKEIGDKFGINPNIIEIKDGKPSIYGLDPKDYVDKMSEKDSRETGF